MSSGVIKIRGLEVETRIGVPEEERAESQKLLIDIEMVPGAAFSAMDDDVARTIDYHAVAVEVASLAATGERRLIEALADEIADHVLGRHAAREVKVRIRKFILPQTEWVGVELGKSAE